MKYILISLLFILGGCSAVGNSVATKESYSGNALLDTNALHCPANTVKMCEGPNRKNLTCKCVRNMRIQSLDFQYMGSPF
mgnify:CR=1 FL=1